MKTNIIKRFDKLGRIVIPKKMRDGMRMGPETDILISVSGNKIVLECAHNLCLLCGEAADKDSPWQLCEACVSEISQSKQPKE
ncbi:MAG: AbrB/MazE/SpoVT family DNA-binding domain-containing protein [Eubacteriales bacterium]